MLSRSRSTLFPILGLVLLSAAAHAGAAAPPHSWSGTAFSGNPAEMAKEASTLEHGKGFDAIVLLDERQFTVDAAGALHQRYHLIYRVNSAAGVTAWASTGLYWEPWHQKQPSVRARVITTDGVEHVLDLKTMSDTPARENESQVYTDSRVYRGPLPAVEIGAVVEEELTAEDTAPGIPGGIVSRSFVGRRVPVEQVRIVIEAPSSVPLKYEVRLLPSAQTEKTAAEGLTRITIENGPLDAIERHDSNIPGDVISWPQVEFSTVPSWKQAATAYQKMAEPQIHLDDVRQLVNETVAPKDFRADKVRKLTAKLHQLVRYTGIEFGESKLVPQTPADVLQRKYGDCKDKAATLVAMLRAAGVPAHLALLNASEGQDVSAAMPGDNLFNHAIVFVPGKPEIWIDATDEFSPPGQLAANDQGRLALVIADGTTDLLRTPLSTPADNLLVENREFYLSEFGPARVVENSESHGAIDRFYRSYFGTNRESKKIQKDMEGYIKSVYMSEDLSKFERGDGTDLTQPFLLRIEATKAKRGQTSLRDTRMAILPASIVSRLPDYFKKSDEDLKKETAGAQKPVPPRTFDYLLPTPFVTEWRYKIMAPPGFKVRAVPDNRTQDMGPAKFSQTYVAAPDGAAVTATLRFDTVKGRYTVDEADALRKAIAALQKANAIVISFDQVGYALLSAGKTRESITAFDSLVKMHPTEALHHIQLADGLLEAGLAEAARSEAQEAIRLEPNSALAHKTYGWILQHDLIGRRFKKGFDLRGAVDQYHKALELDPDDDDTRIDYAILLEHDADGERYSEKADLKASVEQYRELKTRKSSWSALDNNLLFALFYSHQLKDVEDLIGQLESDDTRISMAIAARAALQGSEAALKKSLELTSDEKARMTALSSAAGKLLGLREYKPAAELLEKINNSDLSADMVQAIARTQPYESLPRSESDPISFVRKVLELVVGPSTPDPSAREMFIRPAKQRWDKPDDDLRMLRRLHYYVRNEAVPDLSDDVRGDVFLSNMRLSSEGDDKTGYRVSVQGLGLSSLYLYVIKEGDRYRLLPYNDISPWGKIALALSREGNLAGARQWLDWAREELSVSGGDDPLRGPIFPHVWHKGGNADKETIDGAASTLLVYSLEVEPLLPTLEAARRHAADEAQRNAYDYALANAYGTLRRYSEDRVAAERLLHAMPDSDTAVDELMWVLIRLGDWKTMEQLARERLARNPNDATAIENLSDARLLQGSAQEAYNVFRAALEKAKPTAPLWNNYAWNGLLLDKLPDDVVEAAQRANRLGDNKEFPSMHTLASVYAEVGRVQEAHELVLKLLDVAGLEEPDDSIWYVVGRIAEQYGRTDTALSAYQRLEKISREDDPLQRSTYVLAARGIERINRTTGTKQPPAPASVR